MVWQPFVAIPTLAGSLSSLMATSMVIGLFLLSNGEKSNFRYALIMNLTFAEFINSLNNSISGSYVVAKQDQVPLGDACSANGWIGQVSVQAADFSVLAIAIVTLLTIKRKACVLNASFTTIYFMCLSVWLVPIITGSVALFLGKMSASTGNWCWISNDPRMLRYLLGHGWRLGIFIAIVIIYMFVFVSLSRHLRSRKQYNTGYSFHPGHVNPAIELNLRRVHNDLLHVEKKPSSPKSVCQEIPCNASLWGAVDDEPAGKQEPVPSRKGSCSSSISETRMKSGSAELAFKTRIRVIESSELDQEMWQWFIMVLYPMTYILLWIPGIANRMVELTGNKSWWLTTLQASTQLTGLVNALIFGFREHRGTWNRWLTRYLDRHYS